MNSSQQASQNVVVVKIMREILYLNVLVAE